MKTQTIYILLILVEITSVASSQHIDRAQLDSAILKADKLIQTDQRVFFRNVESFLVWVDGSVIFEKYYGGTNRDSFYLLQSQTKSIVSLLMGIAIDKGFVPNENELVRKYFPAYFKSADSPKSRLTIRDLLTMSAGFEWEEMTPANDPSNDNMKMYRSNNYLHYILSKSVVRLPFSAFQYNSGCPMIIAGIIERASGMSMESFAQTYLLGPLNIDKYSWLKDSTGFCHAGGGLSLKPSDVLKIGVLVLQDGIWEDREIISKNWIERIAQPYFPTGFDIGQYGYFWWVREMPQSGGSTTKVITAEGAGGQRLYIFPQYRLIVAFTERNYSTPLVSPLFIKESILPILR